jgi:hypothetical protein
MIDKLRAHHFLCLTTYQGSGYSAEFVETMDQVWEAARLKAIGQVSAVAEADPICHACPHLQDRQTATSCRFQESIGARDRRMLTAMGWQEGQEVDFAGAMQVAHDRHRELMGVVCVGCEWTAICGQERFTLRDSSFQLPTRPASTQVETLGP